MRVLPINTSILPGFWTKLVLRTSLSAAGVLMLLMTAAIVTMPLLALPDSEIIFEADFDGDADIYRMDIRFNTLVKLTHNTVHDHDPAWSTATRQIAFSSETDSSGRTAIYVMDETGENLHRVTPLDGNYWNSAWSSDGSSLVYLLNYGNIHVMNFEAKTERYLGYGFAPAWSPVEARIASYANQRDTLNADIYVVDADGRGVQNVTQHPANDWDPAWSPDGRGMVFVSSRDGNAELYIMDTATGNVRRLTDIPFAALTPAWSYDGQQIVFAAEMNGVSRIQIIMTDGSGLRDVLPGRSPVWMDFVDR